MTDKWADSKWEREERDGTEQPTDKLRTNVEIR